MYYHRLLPCCVIVAFDRRYKLLLKNQEQRHCQIYYPHFLQVVVTSNLVLGPFNVLTVFAEPFLTIVLPFSLYTTAQNSL